MQQSPQQFDFAKVGKKMPYQTPDGFFERSEAELKAQVRIISKRHKIHRRWWYGIAASVTLLTALFAFNLIGKNDKTEYAPVYCQNANNAEDWEEFAEADIFLENMDW